MILLPFKVQFHPQQPEHFFSCSEDGDVWHWNGANAANQARLNFSNQFASSKSIIASYLKCASDKL